MFHNYDLQIDIYDPKKVIILIYRHMVQAVSIKNVSKNDKSLEIEWNDGEKSNFHFMWLRDNCPYGVHPTARQRSFNLLTVSNNIHPKTYSITQDGKLEIKWSEGEHTSHFDPLWLRNHCYTINNKKPYTSPYVLWDARLKDDMGKVTVECEEVMNSDEGLIKWMEQLHHYGFSLLHNAPTEKKSALKILHRISHIRETFFGTPFDVINIPKPNNTAYTSLGLRNHSDLPYYEYMPGYQFLHCLVNDAKGGLSLVIDGFHVAKYLKENDPSAFEILAKTHVKFKDNDYTQNKIRIFYSPMIKLTKDNDFSEIRFSVATMAAMDCPPNEMEKFYFAYKKFAKLVHDDEFAVKFRIKAGDILSFDNRRILHGRTEFDPNSGLRHLQGYYSDRDEILSRLNYLKKIEI